MTNTAESLDVPTELVAELTALQLLAVKHRREYMRLRTQELAKLTGQPVRFTRDRMTPAQLAELPDVLDSTGAVLEAGQKVKCPDGVRAEIERVDRRSRRCVVDRVDGTKKMTVATRLTIVGNSKRRTHAA